MTTQKALMAETAVIGALLMHNDLLDDVLGELKEDDFSIHFLRRAFVAICEMRKRDPTQPIDIITVTDHIKITHKENESMVFVELAEVANYSYSAANIKAYVEMVKKESNKRKTAQLLNLSAQKIANGDEDYLDYLRNGLMKIENNCPFVVTPFKDLLDQVMVRLQEDCEKGGGITGLPTGFYDLDDVTNGLQAADLIILAARPSMGKTLLMLNIADNISFIKTNEPVVLFSLEMPASQIIKRSLSRTSRVKGDILFKSKLNGEDWEKMSLALEQMGRSKLFINDNSRMSVYQMRSYCRKIRNEHGLKAVFIDYIGLMDGEGENETLRLGNISRDLKALAKDFNVPVFVLCQLNRKIEERKDRTPMLSDIRQSGNIEQDADIVMFLDRDKDIGLEAKLYIAKHRNGRLAEITLTLDLEHFEFKNNAKF